VEADALLVYHDALVGSTRSKFVPVRAVGAVACARWSVLNLAFEQEVAVCLEGLAPSNSERSGLGGAAAVPSSPSSAALSRVKPRSTPRLYQVMGYPGSAPNGYAEFSYKRKLATELTSRAPA